MRDLETIKRTNEEKAAAYREKVYTIELTPMQREKLLLLAMDVEEGLYPMEGTQADAGAAVFLARWVQDLIS